MAQGFNPKRNQKKPAAAKGGKITGPGTGTSDDIQKEIPSGSYIMPADSTEAVGQGALEGMGRGVPIGEPVDALVSDGEYEFTPEQVHAIGVQALDKVRQATTETGGAMGGYGFHPDMDDEHSIPLPKFAAGGEVDDERRKQTSFSQFDPANRPQQVAPPLAMPPQQESPNIVDSAAQDIQRRAQETPTAAQPDTPKQATLGDVVMEGSGTAQVGPFEVSHLPQYGNRNTGGTDSGDGFLSRAWDGAKNTLKEADAIRSDVTNMALGYGTAPFSAVVDKAREGLTELAGGDISTLDGGPSRHMDASVGVGNMGYSNLARRASAAKDSIQAGMRSMLGVEKAEEPSPPPAPAASSRATSTTQEPTEKTESPVTESPSATAAAEPTTQEPERYASGIQKPPLVDGVRSFTNEHVKGFDPGSVNTISSQAMSSMDPSMGAQLARARADAVARGESLPGARGFPAQGGTRFSVVQDTGRLERERNKAFNAASTAHKGAQNGQLTAAQLNSMRGLISDDRADTRAGERLDLDRQAGARDFARVGYEASRLDLDQRKQVLDEISKMPDIQQAQVRTGLYQQYQAAAEAGDTERTQAIAGMLQELGGKNSENLRNNFMAVGGGQEWDSQAGVMRNVPQRLVDLRSGQEVGGQPERRTSVSMDEVKATAKARGVSEKQVMEMLKQQGVSVNG